MHVSIASALAADGVATARLALPATLPEPPELVRGALPDPGPRFERITDSPAWSQFEQGVALYFRSHHVEARLHFANMLRERREPALTSSIQAFLAESSLKSESLDVRPMEIIEQYRALLRENPHSTTAKRAAWRIGDMYRTEGWFQEAQIAYQHALSLSDHDSYDANRALLGLGYALRGVSKWKDSVQAFDNVLKRTTDPSLLVSASMGQAHSLYRLGRIKDADTLYESLVIRWPAVFRKDPYALLRYADTAGEGHRLAVMREQLLRFYNLYPARPENPFVLAHVADSYKEAGRWEEASLFYAALVRQYRDTPIAAMAKLRYADVQEHRDPEDGLVNLRQTVTGQISNIPLAFGETLSPRRLFEQAAHQYKDSPVGSEALFHLGEAFERAGKLEEALAAYERVVLRAGRIENDPWPDKSGAQLMTFLRPRLEAAVKAQDDYELVSLFHRHGPLADRLYAGTAVLRTIADAHQRLGFPVEAARLYQSLIRDPKAEPFHEEALMGLGRSYLEQKDTRAARSVFERYRLQFPIGRFGGEAVRGILTCFERDGNVPGLIKLGRQWLQHHPRHADRMLVHLKVADALEMAKQYGDAAAAYDDILKSGMELPAADAMRYADALVYLNRHASALTFYKQALVAGLSSEQEAWTQFQIVRLAHSTRRQDLAQGGLRSLSENNDSLVRRMAAVLRTGLAQSVSPQGGR
ncbi:MAG: tetratricopeptide repeat protein [Nitrospira sp.]|nr:tetratricopeptide repeat protein [Nitrospira sp.]